MVACVEAWDLRVLVLVVDDGEPLNHAGVNPAGLVLCRLCWVIWELIHQRSGQRPAVLGNPDGLGLFEDVDAVRSISPSNAASALRSDQSIVASPLMLEPRYLWYPWACGPCLKVAFATARQDFATV